MLTRKTHERPEIVRIDLVTFFLDRENGTLTRTDDPSKKIHLKDMAIDSETGSIEILWDKLTGMPYEGYKLPNGHVLKTAPVLLPRHILDKNPPPKARRFRR
jgi:hypothetical protein